MAHPTTAIRRAGDALRLVRHDDPATLKAAAVAQATTILTVALAKGPDECGTCGRVGCFCDQWGGVA